MLQFQEVTAAQLAPQQRPHHLTVVADGVGEYVGLVDVRQQSVLHVLSVGVEELEDGEQGHLQLVAD